MSLCLVDDIHGIVNASDNAEWKGIARSRLDELNNEIDRLTTARAYLEGALLCRYDHPLTECRIMGTETERRLHQPLDQTS